MFGEFRRFLSVCVAIGGMLMLPASFVMAQTPTAEQIQLYNALTPEQKQQAIQMYRRSGGSAKMVTTGEFSSAAAPQSPQQPDSEVPSAPDRSGDRAKEATGQAKEAPAVEAGNVLTITRSVLAVAKREDNPQSFVPEVRPYPVDRDGRLWLPGEPPVTVAGWTASEVTAALSIMPFANGMPLTVSILPREKQLDGLDLKPFGYGLFRSGKARESHGFGTSGARDATQFAPVTRDYVIGPGDVFLVQLFGKEPGEYELEVTRDGTLLIPKFGPVQVAGLPFDTARALITNRIRHQSLGVDVSVTMGPLRSIAVFVTGEVSSPGLQRVRAMGTITDALFAAGGVETGGSLRNIMVKRGGKELGSYDLYDLLLAGNNQNDRRLEAGDVVFVPTVTATVAVGGSVRRPAIYELKGGETVGSVLAMAGGMAFDAAQGRVRLVRSDPAIGQRAYDVAAADFARPVQNGDLIRVYAKIAAPYRGVVLQGNVAAAGTYAWWPGMRLGDLLTSSDTVLPDADLTYVLIARTLPGGERVYLQSQLAQVFASPDSEQNLPLQDLDEVRVFSRDEDRASRLAPDVAALSQQAVAGRVPRRVVHVGGEVHHPGDYPLTQGMRVLDLLVAAGDVTHEGYAGEAELVRYDTSGRDSEGLRSRHEVDLVKARQGDGQANFALMPGDILVVRKTSTLLAGGTIELAGEVRFPGVYTILPGETLSQVLVRAGGVTQHAFLPGAVYTREEVRQRESAERERLARLFEADLARIAVEPASLGRGEDKGQVLAAGQELLNLMRSAPVLGRLSLNLQRGENDHVVISGMDPHLAEGDRFYIPSQPDSVLVMGEVYHPTAHLFRKGESVRSYLDMSGGITHRGDADNVLVVHADGSVSAVDIGWLHSGGLAALGDAVVVPQKIETFSSLKMVTDITQILYQLALTAASAKAVGVL